MLVHMTPGEVQGLQAIALAHGGSLTINPHTGLPEAGFLKNILPALAAAAAVTFLGPAAGAATGALGLGAAGTGAVAGGLTGALLNKENPLMGALTGGLGGYGIGGGMGALIEQGAGISGHQAGLQAIGGPEAFTGANFAPITPTPPTPDFLSAGVDAADTLINPSMVTDAATAAPLQAAPNPIGQRYAEAYQAAQPTDAMGRMRAAGTGLQNITEPGFMANLGQQFPTTGSKAAAGLGAAGMLGAFDQPKFDFAAPQQQASNYRAQKSTQRPYDPTAPGGYYFTDRGILQPAFAAKGGEMHSVPELEDGGFVLTKKAVDGIGKGDNERGQRAAAAGLGAIPIKGPGTSTSDSIPTTIDGERPALLSNGEAYVPRDQVKRRGGAKKFYALMKQAEQSARRA